MSGKGPRSDDPDPDAAAAHEEASAHEVRKRALRNKHIDDVFGQTVPTVTDDERDPGGRHGFSAEHYRSSRPPHHGQR